MNINLFSGIGGWELGIEIANSISNNKMKNFFTDLAIDSSELSTSIYKLNFSNNCLTADVKNLKEFQNVKYAYVSFPCTGTSIAGNKSGLNHPESSLWFTAFKLINGAETIFIEQPSFFNYTGLHTLRNQLNFHGYTTSIVLLTASMFGLPQKRERMFIIASNTYNVHKFYWSKSSWSNSFRKAIERVISFRKESQIVSTDSSMGDGISRKFFDIDHLHIYGSNKNDSSRWKKINCLAMSIVPDLTAAIILGYYYNIEQFFSEKVENS